MRVQVIFASLLMLTVTLAGCITDSAIEQLDEITESLGCMDADSLNYDKNATNSSGLCLSEEQLLLAEEVFWSSWDEDAVKNTAEPIGYRLIITETSTDENNSTSEILEIQEVFSSEYYDQKIVYRSCGSGLHDSIHCIVGGNLASTKSSQTVFDNSVQVEKFSDGEWDNYSMKTASSYDSFRNRLEHGPGIAPSSPVITQESGDVAEDSSAEGREQNAPESPLLERVSLGFPPIETSEFESIVSSKIEISAAGGHQQTIHYFAKDQSSGVEVEVMGVMTEDGFKITGLCNYNHATTETVIGSYMGVESEINSDRSNSAFLPWHREISSQILLLESETSQGKSYHLHFAGDDYSEPVDKSFENKPIPFYFEWISDSNVDETESESATEGKKGLNAVNVKVAIAGPSGPFGTEGVLSAYRLFTSTCSFDDATTGEDVNTESENDNNTDNSTDNTTDNTTDNNTEARGGGKGQIYGSDENTCTNIDGFLLSDYQGMLDNGITFVDADSSGTLSEGDRFEFSDDYTCDNCDEANMLRLECIFTNQYSDENINPSSEMSSIHQGAMNSIRNIRAVASDDLPPPVRAVDHNTTRSNRGG